MKKKFDLVSPLVPLEQNCFKQSFLWQTLVNNHLILVSSFVTIVQLIVYF